MTTLLGYSLLLSETEHFCPNYQRDKRKTVTRQVFTNHYYGTKVEIN